MSVSRIREVVAAAMVCANAVALELDPVPAHPDGLVNALRVMAQEVTDGGETVCRFKGNDAIRVHDAGTAIGLFRIAERFVRETIKVGCVEVIAIHLKLTNKALELDVRCDVCGPRSHGTDAPEAPGYRWLLDQWAKSIGATVAIIEDRKRGFTVLTCSLSNQSDREQPLADLEDPHGE